MTAIEGIWESINSFGYAVPIFMIQIILIITVTRALDFLLHFFHQPRAVAEIIGGIILGPTLLGRVDSFPAIFFPMRSLLTLETVAQLGLIYFLFLVGVETDSQVIHRSGQKAFIIGAAGAVLSFGISAAAGLALRNFLSQGMKRISCVLFIGVCNSATAFPVLAQILAKTKLLNSEIGRITISAAMANNAIMWILFTLALSISEFDPLSSLWITLSGFAFVTFCIVFVRPVMRRLVQRIPEGQLASDFHVCLLLSFMMLAGVLTEAIGIYAITGAFLVGFMIPNGPVKVAVSEKTHDIVYGIMMPLYCIISGLKTDLTLIHRNNAQAAAIIILVSVLGAVAKIVGIFIVSGMYTMTLRDGLTLGFLLNSRGLIELLILNIGRIKQLVDEQSFSVMVVMSVVMTVVTTPVASYLQRPLRRIVGYKRRNLQRSKPDMELRVLACVHNTRNVPSIITLLDVTCPTKRSPIFVYVVHLIELAGRTSTMLIVHSSDHLHQRPTTGASGPQGQGNHIFHAFDKYERQTGGVSVQTLSIISPYSSMHEDICSLAEDKHVTIIIIPFHKQQTVDGGLEPINPNLKIMNENVLANSPCSVGILIDRGLSSKSRHASEDHHLSRRIALLFFGGTDDREALAYCWRAVENPSIGLTVVRFVPVHEPSPPPSALELQEAKLDDDYLNEFRVRNASNDSVVYVDQVTSSTEETVAAIRAMGDTHDLYVVGRSQSEAATSLTAGLTEWAECPELGPIGDLLASSDFAMSVSVLVVHQYVGTIPGVPPPGPAAGDDGEQRFMNHVNPKASFAATT
ncbi:cation/H(+) antiporter 15-like [Zingiber officinale]|uniref:Cation/H+ exchanger domain-containing protein n=1 Tax=Zingiber officinale TaxID=94328 RepID=A0A8J5KBE7_ZINOF|nr:cation/H(+) antiporter 15-like [Zingiber officinale]KAG6480281.1 hypothetical protein ZIOFF_063761 [Zingiber officinale]